MSQYFSFPRFGRLLRKHFAEHLTTYALSGTVLLAGTLAVMGFLSYVSGGLGPSAQAALFMLGVLAAGSFFTSTVLAEYGQGSGAALALTLPASHLEKFLLAWLVSVPGFLLAFTGIFYLADWLVLTLGHHADMLVNLFESQQWVLMMLSSFLLMHAVMLWGSIFFRRQQFVRTGFLLFAVVLVISVLNYQMLKGLIGEEMRAAMPLANVKLENGLSLSLPESQARWLGWLPVALVLLLWPAAYARLTEKQL